MNPLLRLIPRLAFLPLALALAVPAARAQDQGGTTRAKFSDPGKPGTLKLSLPWAEVRVTGTDGDEIVVASTLDETGEREVDEDGFRRLDEETTFEFVEEGNVVTLRLVGDNAWAAHGAEFEIQVPRSTSLVVRTQAGGDILVENVEGDIDINSMNGEVTLRDIASSAVVNTMNGEISASFKRAPEKPVSFSSLNGEIDVRLPADTKANLRMRTHNGSIRTNFPDNVLQTKTEKVSGPAPAPAGAPGAEAAPETEGTRINRDREAARYSREQARMAKEMAREAAKAAEDIARAVADVHVELNINGIPVPPVAPVPPVPGFGGKTIVGTLNGGGVHIKLTSMNGAITLRQGK